MIVDFRRNLIQEKIYSFTKKNPAPTVAIYYEKLKEISAETSY